MRPSSVTLSEGRGLDCSVVETDNVCMLLAQSGRAVHRETLRARMPRGCPAYDTGVTPFVLFDNIQNLI